MKQVDAYTTMDGAIHLSYEDAKRHTDKRYGDALSRLAHTMATADRYSSVMDYLDTNLGQLNELIQLKADCTLEESE